MPRGRLLLFGVRALIAAAIAAPFWFWKGGVLELEVLQFIRQYLDDRSLLRKIFDPYTNDFRTYQAREFSYFIDYLDARVFARLMHWDVALFIPLSAVVASLLTVVVFVIASRRYRQVPPLTSSLLLLAYVTNYVFLVTTGMFYRSTKPLLAPVLMATTFYVAALIGGSGGDTRRRAPFVVFGLFCLMGLLDRQGFFYAVVGLAVLTGFSALSRRGWAVAGAGAAAVVSMTIYDVWMGPLIVQSVNQYVPSLAYQEVPREQLLQALTPYRQAAELLSESVTLLLGSTSVWVSCALPRVKSSRV